MTVDEWYEIRAEMPDLRARLPAKTVAAVATWQGVRDTDASL
jgi:hypothetical protein